LTVSTAISGLPGLRPFSILRPYEDGRGNSCVSGRVAGSALPQGIAAMPYDTVALPSVGEDFRHPGPRDPRIIQRVPRPGPQPGAPFGEKKAKLTSPPTATRGDVRDTKQRALLETYLLDPRSSAQELQTFAGIFPNADYMISTNLLVYHSHLPTTNWRSATAPRSVSSRAGGRPTLRPAPAATHRHPRPPAHLRRASECASEMNHAFVFLAHRSSNLKWLPRAMSCVDENARVRKHAPSGEIGVCVRLETEEGTEQTVTAGD